MAYEMKEGCGTLMKNNRKEKEGQPDYTGRVMVNGKELRIAGWKKTSQNGNAYLSLKVSEPQQPQETEGVKALKETFKTTEIPF